MSKKKKHINESTVRQAANRMHHDLNTKGAVRVEDVVRVLGNPAKRVSIAPLSAKHKTLK